MKTITRKMGYVTYSQVRDALLEFIPFAVTCQYSPDMELAVFKFDDSSYIPECMRLDSLNIKGNTKLVEKVNNKIKRMLERD